MNAITTSNSLKEQKKLLRLQLRNNRHVLDHTILDLRNGFPRSFAMRLLTQRKTAKAMSMLSLSLTGLRCFRFIGLGLSALTLLKHTLARRDHKINIEQNISE